MEWFLSPSGKMYRGKKAILKVSFFNYVFLKSSIQFQLDKPFSRFLVTDKET